MKRKLLFGVTICLALTGIMLSGGASKAFGFGWGRHAYRGWYGGWCRPAVYRSYWAGYGGWYGGWHGGWYGGSCGTNWCGCCSCYNTCCYSCYSCVDCCGCCSDGSVIEETYQEIPTEPDELEPVPADDAEASAQRSAFLNLRVPADTRVFVNGQPTKSTGSDRLYVSRGLKPGSKYKYVLLAEAVRNGVKVTRTRTVMLQAGNSQNVTFDFSGDGDMLARQSAETNLKVHVPKDAMVFLSGNKTQSTGRLREFSTSHLEPGQKWAGYEIRVEAESHGQKLSQTKIVTLSGGQTHEVRFDFEGPQLDGIASR